jgi:hypothetical protein
MKFSILFSITIILLACENGASGKEGETKEERVLAILESKGLNTDNAEFTDGRVVVENDISFNIDNVLSYGEERSKGRLYQWGKISSSRVNKIYVIIYPEVPSNWVTAVKSAMGKWNNISLSGKGTSNINLKLGTFGNTYENAIRVMIGKKPSGEFPFNGYPGCVIYVPEEWNDNADEFEDTILLHEMGHTLGFAHSGNHFNTSDPISGTGTDPKDGGYFSIMQSGGRLGYLTYDDKLSAIKLYPEEDMMR